jgi:hypothetical protein
MMNDCSQECRHVVTAIKVSYLIWRNEAEPGVELSKLIRAEYPKEVLNLFSVASRRPVLIHLEFGALWQLIFCSNVKVVTITEGIESRKS